MVALADTVNTQDILDNFTDVLDGVRYQKSLAESSKAGERTRRMGDTALGSLYQMVSLLQADLLLLKNEVHRPVREDTPMHSALERNGGYPVSDTGLSIDSYIGIAEWLSEYRDARSSHSFEFVVAGLRTLYAIRAENIRSAMKDTYNWRMLLRPTELLDLDSLILMCLALGNEHVEYQLVEFLREESPICQAPLIIARDLSRNQGIRSGQ